MIRNCSHLMRIWEESDCRILTVLQKEKKSPRVHKRNKITAKKSGEIEGKFGKDEEH